MDIELTEISKNMIGHIDKSKEVLRLAAKMSKQYYGKPLIVCYSGGKDSDVLLHLAKSCLANDEFEVLNSHTTVDAPETVYHIREVFKRLEAEGIKTEIRKPTYKGKPVTMWSLIPQKALPPTRIQRYCCSVLKEASTPNRFIAVGVRESESLNRHGRDVFSFRAKKAEAQYYSLEHAKEVYADAQTMDDIWDCQLIAKAKKQKDLICNPIYEWTNSDVWKYIRENNIKYNPLYDEGFHRVGCVMCPMGGRKGMLRDAERWPKYKRAYIRAFDRLIEERERKGRPFRGKSFLKNSGQGVYDWWIGTDQCEGQLKLDIDKEG